MRYPLSGGKKVGRKTPELSWRLKGRKETT
jgi:hypothetical protein